MIWRSLARSDGVGALKRLSNNICSSEAEFGAVVDVSSGSDSCNSCSTKIHSAIDTWWAGLGMAAIIIPIIPELFFIHRTTYYSFFIPGIISAGLEMVVTLVIINTISTCTNEEGEDNGP